MHSARGLTLLEEQTGYRLVVPGSCIVNESFLHDAKTTPPRAMSPSMSPSLSLAQDGTRMNGSPSFPSRSCPSSPRPRMPFLGVQRQTKAWHVKPRL